MKLHWAILLELSLIILAILGFIMMLSIGTVAFVAFPSWLGGRFSTFIVGLFLSIMCSTYSAYIPSCYRNNKKREQKLQQAGVNNG